MDTISALANEFLSQPTIAVVGISSSKQTVANGVYKNLKKGDRTVFAVGRNTSVFDNDACYPDLSSIHVPIDGVFIAAKPENINRIVEECIALKIPRVWMHNMAGTHGASPGIFPKAVQRCRENNITVIPGACPLMFGNNSDFGHKCIRWFLQVSGKLRM